MPITYDGRRQEYISYLGGECVRCGSTLDLEFDHVYWQQKSFSVMKRWGNADQERVYIELNKCQLLCHDHHKIKTKQDQAEMSYYKPITHGTLYAWMKLKCKCEVCNLARYQWNEARNERRKEGRLR